MVVPGTFLRVLYIIHHPVAFARELEEEGKNEQDQPAVPSAVAAAVAAAAGVAAAPAAAATAKAAAAEASSRTASVTAPAVEKQRQQKMPKARANFSYVLRIKQYAIFRFNF